MDPDVCPNTDIRQDITNLKHRMANQEAILEKILAYHKAQIDQNQINRLSHDFAYNVTAIVGLKEALTSENRPIKFIWLFLFLLGVGATMFYLWQTTDEYLENPTVTNIRLAQKTEISFPPLLLCPNAWFDTEKALALNMSLDALKYSLSYFMDTLQDQLSNVSAAKQEFLSIYASYQFESLLDYYKAISPNMVMETSKIGSSSTFTYACRGCQDNRIVEKTTSDRRLCYIFYLKPVESGLGVYSGVRRIYIKFRDPTSGVITNLPDWEVYFNPVEDSAVSMYPKVTVRPFSNNFVKFYEQKFIMMNTKNAPCQISEKVKNYSSVTCMTQCHNKFYKKYLDCSLSWLSLLSSRLPPNESCNHQEKYPPRNGSLNEFFESEENALIDSMAGHVCVEQCPRECDRMILDTTLQSETKSSEVRRNSDGSYPKQTLFRLELDLKHGVVYQGGVMVLTEEPIYTFTQLVNNIGGTLGLFVGGTLMTFAQLILFLVSYLVRKRKK